MALFPNVPNVPGVPPLLRNPLSKLQGLGSSAIGSLQIGASAIGLPAQLSSPNQFLQLLTGDAPGLLDSSPQAPWGVYKDGEPVIAADSCIALDFRKEWVISDYQIEGGKFEDYDKVEEPFETTVRLSAGGSIDNREAFLQSIEAIAGDTELYDVVTPERTYQSANVTSYDYSRTNIKGLGLMQVDIRLEEVRETAEAAFSNTQQPGGAGQKNDGTVQTSPPTPKQESALHSRGF